MVRWRRVRHPPFLIRNAPVTPAVTTRNAVRSPGMTDTQRRRQVLKKCPSCDELQRMDPRAIYCSPACKQAAYRLRSTQGAKRQRCILCQVESYVIPGRDGGASPSGRKTGVARCHGRVLRWDRSLIVRGKRAKRLVVCG
jgi:hypothetical protein